MQHPVQGENLDFVSRRVPQLPGIRAAISAEMAISPAKSLIRAGMRWKRQHVGGLFFLAKTAVQIARNSRLLVTSTLTAAAEPYRALRARVRNLRQRRRRSIRDCLLR